MIQTDITMLAGLSGLAFTTATGALVASMVYMERRASRRAGAAGASAPGTRQAVFLFDDGLLVDMSDEASRLLERCPPGDEPWKRLLAFLADGFPGVDPALRALAKAERLELLGEAAGMPLRLQAEHADGLLRLTLIDVSARGALVEIEAARLEALERDAQVLNAMSAHAPGPVWLTTHDGTRLAWANAAYMDLVRERGGEEAAMSWPLPLLFAPDVATPGRAVKVSLDIPSRSRPRWFEITAADAGDTRIHFAAAADATVRAELAMREVVQTLAKTFAHLPIGLAIFGRDRRLTLFNPALTDLSGLPPSFLGERPALTSVLDELRNRRIIAEPKDYRSWRQMITQLEAEAQQGTYADNWSLPDGRTFRVTGRPHPDGAIAFLFEDITDEIALTRRFRKDTALGQAILDELPLALAVFSRDGTMTLANAAYTALWGIDPGAVLGDVGMADTARRWIERTAPTPIWGDVRDFVTVMSDRSEWTGEISMLDGRLFELRCTPLPGGDALVAFVEIPREARRLPEPAEPMESWSI